MKRLIFTHIQKAAGSSVNAFFDTVRSRRGARVLAIGGAPAKAAGDPAAILRKHGLDRRRFDIVTGHVPFASARDCFGDAVFATGLRDPVSRMLSDFCSQPTHADLPDRGLARLEQAVAARHDFALDNLQVRMLCDDPRFGTPATPAMLAAARRNLTTFYGVVGFADDLGEFLSAIGRLYGVAPPTAPRLNVTAPYLDIVTDEHRAVAARHSVLDAELYAWAKTQTFGPAAGMKPRLLPGRKLVAGPVLMYRVPDPPFWRRHRNTR